MSYKSKYCLARSRALHDATEKRIGSRVFGDKSRVRMPKSQQLELMEKFETKLKEYDTPETKEILAWLEEGFE